MAALRRWVVFLGLLAVIGAGAWLWWDVTLRGTPHTLTREQPAIARLLQTGGWVAPNAAGRPAYLLVGGTCPHCADAESAFTALGANGVSPRLIAIAPADENGRALSTPAERSAVAELWLNRDWNFWKRWAASGGSLPDLRSADGDAARTAVVETGRATAAQLKTLLKANHVRFGYPLAIWWNKAGDMRASVLDSGAALGKAKHEIAGG